MIKEESLTIISLKANVKEDVGEPYDRYLFHRGLVAEMVH
jgi:hypothetical protein